MRKKQVFLAVLALVVIGTAGWFFIRTKPAAKKINIKQEVSSGPANTGNVSPISGIACENWNKRPIAVMQPSDVQARPAAGFSEADMVVEMPAYTGSVTRLMGVYLCTIPKEIGAIRSSRHDYIPIAKGLDAVFIYWGGSHFALDLLSQKIIDGIDCMTSSACSRWPITGIMRLEDTGHITKEKIAEAMDQLGFRKESNFSGYPHQNEAPLEDRPEAGRLRIAFKSPYDVSYDYDKASNSYLRIWDSASDMDRNNGQRIAPKNVVALIAESSQITLDQDYTGQGLQDPWKNVEEIKKTGVESISGRYNNIQIGDPWYDSIDSGEAHYYLNGQEYRGTWKKDRSKIDSKLTFFNESGEEMKFVPGQIWVEVLEPGQSLRWAPGV